MREIKRLANNFRNAIDTAFEKGELRKYPLFSRFPNECCDLTCDLLGQYLLESGIETYQVNGAYINDISWRHVWLVTIDSIVIDITGDQFINKLNTINKINPVYVGLEGEIQKKFCIKRQIEENTEFLAANVLTGFKGTPNPRQKVLREVYSIILKYL